MLVAAAASGSIIFDDFNIDEGHFGSGPSTSATSVGEDATSMIDRILTGNLEGNGSQLLHLVHDATTTALRIRHLSGAGTPANNLSFAVSALEDGFIGFYLKTTATGWETSINLDGPANSTAQMRGSTSIPIIADGEWHLYEWSLDSATWGSVPGVVNQTTGALPDLTYTIDSIYFRDLDGTPGPTADIQMDFVAKSDSGSIGGLVPEPSAAMIVLLGGVSAVGLCRRRG